MARQLRLTDPLIQTHRNGSVTTYDIARVETIYANVTDRSITASYGLAESATGRVGESGVARYEFRDLPAPVRSAWKTILDFHLDALEGVEVGDGTLEDRP